MWEVYLTEKYLNWFSDLSEFDKEEIYSKVGLLKEYGTNLGRPHADTLKGSKKKNLKELRVKTDDHVFKIAFYFDEKRNGILLAREGKMRKYFIKKKKRGTGNNRII